MVNVSANDLKVGWRFDNSYARFPEALFSRLSPEPVKKPKLVILNDRLTNELGLNFSNLDNEYVASLFSGNSIPLGSQSIAQAYAGHQFGHFTMLGDGRAILIGEHLNTNNLRFDVQLKGSGRTPYSRNGDGRAALGPVLREYIISEAMHDLNIPSTRSLAVVTTGEKIMRETFLPGAILTRIASSHIRVGTYQYIATLGDKCLLKSFVDYTIKRHYPSLIDSKNPALSLLSVVMKKQIKLITSWMRVGFVHGVMNTDNTSISGETIDYGPCAFMDAYNPEAVFSSIDHRGRYAYCNQPSIIHWNLSRFAETLLPLIHKKQDKAIEMVLGVINNFGSLYKAHWLKMMRNKIGLLNEEKNDIVLINDLLSWMHKKNADYTNTFVFLIKGVFSKEGFYEEDDFLNWHKRWCERLKQNQKNIKFSLDLMRSTNPLVIPRNHKVEEALDAAIISGDLAPARNLINVLKNPYKEQGGIKSYQLPGEANTLPYKTFCGT